MGVKMSGYVKVLAAMPDGWLEFDFRLSNGEKRELLPQVVLWPLHEHYMVCAQSTSVGRSRRTIAPESGSSSCLLVPSFYPRRGQTGNECGRQEVQQEGLGTQVCQESFRLAGGLQACVHWPPHDPGPGCGRGPGLTSQASLVSQRAPGSGRELISK